MSGRGFAAAVAVALTILVGCSGEDPPTAVPPSPRAPASSVPSTSAPTTTAPATSTAPTGAPLLPAAATEHTPDGAAAFVQHWFATSTYSFRTLDSAVLLGLGDCLTCRALADTIDAVAARGNLISGGEATVTSIQSNQLRNDGTTTVTAGFTAQEAMEVTADGSLVAVIDPGGEALYFFTLEWAGATWSAASIQLIE